MHGTIAYFVRRILLIIPTFVGITMLSFCIMQVVPGGPVEQMVMSYQMSAMQGEAGGGGGSGMGAGTTIPEDALEEIKRFYGFDKPIYYRYAKWLYNICRFNLGESYRYCEPVWNMISSRFPVSIYFGGLGFLLSYMVCIPLGVWKAVRHSTTFDTASSVLVFVGYSIPGWAAGIVLLTLFGGGSFWNIFPLGELTSPPEVWETLTFGQKVLDLLHHTCLPVLCYVIGQFAALTMLMKNSLMENLGADYVRTAFAKGLDDYARFTAKHETLFGITDDGAVEKGIGHVHAAFTELAPEGLEGALNLLNADMLARAADRARARAQWRIGEPYRGTPVPTLEAKLGGRGGGFPALPGSREPWSETSLTLAIGRTVLAALRETGQIRSDAEIKVTTRAGGYVRAFLEAASEAEAALFVTALHQALGPLGRPRYVIPRLVDRLEATWLSRILPAIVARYFQKRRRSRYMLHAVPAVLAAHKDLVAVYQRHWNRNVSPGEALYAYHGAGEELVETARRTGEVPGRDIHEKKVLL